MNQVNLVKVFIASPGDVLQQRDEIEKLIHYWNNEHTDQTNTILMPIRWEKNSHSEYRENASGQTIINRQIVSDSDLMIALFGYTLGTPINNSRSGTVNEIDYFSKKTNARIGIFFLDTEFIPKINSETIKNVEAYQRELEENNKGLYAKYSPDNIRQFLTKEVNRLLDNDVCEEPLISQLKEPLNLETSKLFDEMDFDDDERLLLIFSMEEAVRTFTLSNHTIHRIIDWENKNNLEKYLSERYYDTLDKLEEVGILKADINEEVGQIISYSIERNQRIEIKKVLKENVAKVNGIKLKKKRPPIIDFKDDSLPF
ncbi:hypothetical protein ABID30_002208 [Enterococcus rotai]|uniref:DUF4062 domain-containing protein n=1 Tax=Enterococcus rotai TaxID=118060 RepID=UPI000ADBBC1D|nr:DUF4062 domain-containing protein [Enterococcus rotai]